MYIRGFGRKRSGFTQRMYEPMNSSRPLVEESEFTILGRIIVVIKEEDWKKNGVELGGESSRNNNEEDAGQMEENSDT